MYNEASQELGSLSIRSTCQEAFAFGLSLKLAFYPYTSHTYSPLPQKARGQPAKELVCFSPRTFLISVRVPFDPLSLLVFSTHNWCGVHDSSYLTNRTELSDIYSIHHHCEAALCWAGMKNIIQYT